MPTRSCAKNISCCARQEYAYLLQWIRRRPHSTFVFPQAGRLLLHTTSRASDQCNSRRSPRAGRHDLAARLPGLRRHGELLSDVPRPRCQCRTGGAAQLLGPEPSPGLLRTLCGLSAPHALPTGKQGRNAAGCGQCGRPGSWEPFLICWARVGGKELGPLDGAPPALAPLVTTLRTRKPPRGLRIARDCWHAGARAPRTTLTGAPTPAGAAIQLSRCGEDGRHLSLCRHRRHPG